MTWRLPAALALSLLLHLMLLWFWRTPAIESEVRRTIEFEMVATRPDAPLPEPEPAPVEPPVPAPVTPVTEEPPIPEPLEPEPVQPMETAAPDPQTLVDAAPLPAEATPLTDPPAGVVLNLNPPPIWDSLIDPEDSAGPNAGFEFNPALWEAVTERTRVRARMGLLSARERAVYGLSAEDYGHTGALGEVVKVDGRCFSLQDTPELGSEPRWWMVKCQDSRASPFELKPLDTDARGRAIAD
ncbi:MAG: hypothetical protein R3E82_02420 [Pseudomonadales bacterium]|nr:hypothetical protein [Pseudomonadales bacterium]